MRSSAAKGGSGSSEADSELGDPAHTANHHMALSSSSRQDTLSAGQASIFSSAFPIESNTLRPYGHKLTLKTLAEGVGPVEALVILDVDTKHS